MLEALTSLPLANLLFITLVVFVGIRFAGRGKSSTRAVSGALWVAGCAVGAWALPSGPEGMPPDSWSSSCRLP
jgi:hypothetical protein